MSLSILIWCGSLSVSFSSVTIDMIWFAGFGFWLWNIWPVRSINTKCGGWQNPYFMLCWGLQEVTYPSCGLISQWLWYLMATWKKLTGSSWNRKRFCKAHLIYSGMFKWFSIGFSKPLSFHLPGWVTAQVSDSGLVKIPLSAGSGVNPYFNKNVGFFIISILVNTMHVSRKKKFRTKSM